MTIHLCPNTPGEARQGRGQRPHFANFTVEAALIEGNQSILQPLQGILPALRLKE
jgi:hypothetical protein